MAKDDDDSIAVQLDDPDTINVDISGDEAVVAPTEKVVKEKRTRQPVVRVSPEEPTGPTPEEALAEAKAFAKQQEDARKAAEATAASERTMREQAQREAQQAQQSAEQYQERANNSELIVIENGIEAAKREVEAYENEYTRAAEAGEFAKMGSIQTKLSRAAAKQERLESEKASFEQNVKRQPTTEGRVVAPETTVTSNVSERYLSQFAPVAQNWLRQHPECWPAEVGGSAQKNSKMMAGHYDAMAQNLTLNSPEYFKVIEEHVNPTIVQQQPTIQNNITSKAADVQVAESSSRASPRAQPSAPVSRDGPSSGGPRSVREVRLSKEQQEFAKMAFPHLPESQAYGQYARNLVELEAEGKIGRLTH
jgi:hypothetical protein